MVDDFLFLVPVRNSPQNDPLHLWPRYNCWYSKWLGRLALEKSKTRPSPTFTYLGFLWNLQTIRSKSQWKHKRFLVKLEPGCQASSWLEKKQRAYWELWKLLPGWISHGRDIGWEKCGDRARPRLVTALSQHDAHFILRSDNMVSFTIWKRPLMQPTTK